MKLCTLGVPSSYSSTYCSYVHLNLPLRGTNRTAKRSSSVVHHRHATNFVAVGNCVQRPAIGSTLVTNGTAGSSVSIVLPVGDELVAMTVSAKYYMNAIPVLTELFRTFGCWLPGCYPLGLVPALAANLDLKPIRTYSRGPCPRAADEPHTSWVYNQIARHPCNATRLPYRHARLGPQLRPRRTHPKHPVRVRLQPNPPYQLLVTRGS
eukprot:COSAG06_NODE_13544_length_1246_cov_1.194420_1_plen_208_part_00